MEQRYEWHQCQKWHFLSNFNSIIILSLLSNTFDFVPYSERDKKSERMNEKEKCCFFHLATLWYTMCTIKQTAHEIAMLTLKIGHSKCSNSGFSTLCSAVPNRYIPLKMHTIKINRYTTRRCHES